MLLRLPESVNQPNKQTNKAPTRPRLPVHEKKTTRFWFLLESFTSTYGIHGCQDHMEGGNAEHRRFDLGELRVRPARRTYPNFSAHISDTCGLQCTFSQSSSPPRRTRSACVSWPEPHSPTQQHASGTAASIWKPLKCLIRPSTCGDIDASAQSRSMCARTTS